ncbi:MAG: 4-hydroxythreonine-4-phosphate dehydrogenase PdxA [Proteobacteria bacterium]|nr:MAG: 4-hydroxythreonine-4-phosphate dehydrogenase PdxA [Pseudomonadota bacterium]PIE40306.1 MAG: 4-hydroxythreonine-4-phosphate dehydrogenase PdxA [Gammaproteobacteria bacterium]
MTNSSPDGRGIIAITPGEPAGIGPDLCVRLAQEKAGEDVLLICDPQLLESRAKTLGLSIDIELYENETSLVRFGEGRVTVAPVPMPSPVSPGEAVTGNARYVLDTLRRAVAGCMRDEFSAMVTGPVHKGVINDAGVAFTGHTEFLQQLAGVSRVVMMLATEGLRVALATTHLPLKDVSSLITRQRLTQVMNILISDLQTRFGIARPKILVAGLNPHAGEGGHLGMEEIEIIEPVMAQFAAHDVDLVGPLPADTLFTEHLLRDADAVLAMYHDQGLPVLKYKGFGRSANITLGLPFIRTSVDHGTAFDLAGTLNADLGSLRYAVQTAREMSATRQRPCQ